MKKRAQYSRNKTKIILAGIAVFLLISALLIFIFPTCSIKINRFEHIYQPQGVQKPQHIYQSQHFIVYSDMNPIYVKLISNHCEAFYHGMTPQYFSKGFNKPLKIYYKQRASESDDVYGCYYDSIPAVYTHRIMRDGNLSGWGTLYHEISHHFIHINYGNTPRWFNEGLAAFLGEKSQIIKGKLIIGFPNPWREQLLRNSIEAGTTIDIGRLITISDSDFEKWDIGCPFTRAFFYWLYSRGKLIEFLVKVKNQWYGVKTIESIFSEKIDVLNKQFMAFIKRDCYAGAYVKDGQDVSDIVQKKDFYTKALNLKPDYNMAKYLLASEVYRKTDIQAAKDLLLNILQDKENTWHMSAALELGDIYCSENNVVKAIEYYQLAWDYSDYFEYKYDIADRIGHCYHYLGNQTVARKWAKAFIKYDWEPEDNPEAYAYLKRY